MSSFMRAAQRPKGGDDNDSTENVDASHGGDPPLAPAIAAAVQPKPHDSPSSSDEDGEGDGAGQETRSQLIKRHQRVSIFWMLRFCLKRYNRSFWKLCWM